MQSVSSSTTSPPDPIMAPTSFSDSKSMGVSAFQEGTHPPDGPPICTALNDLPPATPPPISSTTSLMVIPIGTSMSPPLATFPANAKTLVPLDNSVPMRLNAFAEFLRIYDICAKVSALLIRVGCPHNPSTAG